MSGTGEPGLAQRRESSRMVQEALTNAMKLAPGCPVLVAIRYGHQAMALEVSNELPVAPPGGSLTATGGHRLAVMQQRIQACGGTLEWGLQDGAVSVQARLPVLA